MFVLGVLVGRGTAPVHFDTQALQEELAALRDAMMKKEREAVEKAINKKGTKEAVTFCNERAYTLTDSMARVNRANIKRVSDKPRNQNNKANAKELAHIETFKAMVTNQQELEPIVEEAGNSVNFYYPITTNAMCLQCHGTLNKDIKSDIYKTIKGLYPNDQAIGYDVDQVRGIWSITFDK